MANENRTQDAGHALLRQTRNPKVRKKTGVILDAMEKPDGNASLLELVREAFENSRRRYGYKRIHLFVFN